MNVRRVIQGAVPVAVSVGVLLLLFRGDQIDLLGVLGSIRPEVARILVPAMLVFGVVSLALEAVSLVRMIGTPREGFGLWTAARVKAASYLAYTFHYTVGVGALTVLLRRRAGLALGAAAGVVLVVAAFDLGVALVLLTTGALALGADTPGVQAGLVVAACVAVIGGIALLRAPFSLGPLDRIRDWSVFLRVREAPLGRLVELLFLRVAFSFSFCAMVGAALWAFDVRPPLADVVVGSLFVAIVAALPIAVAGIGTGTAAFVYAFRNFGDPEVLLACSLTLTACMIVLRVGTGLLFAREYAREAIDAVRQGEDRELAGEKIA